MIAEYLAGRRIAITGSTGFLGTALVERLLRSVPDCNLVLIVRPGRRGAQRRVDRDILRNDAFDRLRKDLGDETFDQMAANRITAVAGDVSDEGLGLDEEGRSVLATCDTVIHSAAIVSFDSPLDQAVEVNLLGPVRITETLAELGTTPHLVAVSTCYVAGSRRGAAPEEPVNESPFFVDVNWRLEVESARRIRHELERAAVGDRQGVGVYVSARPRDRQHPIPHLQRRGAHPVGDVQVAVGDRQGIPGIGQVVSQNQVIGPHRAAGGDGQQIAA